MVKGLTLAGMLLAVPVWVAACSGNNQAGQVIEQTPTAKPVGKPKRPSQLPIVAPIHYEKLALVMSDDETVALIDFTKPARHWIAFRYRCLNRKTGEQTTGDGRLHEKYEHRLDLKESIKRKGLVLSVQDKGGQLHIEAGTLKVQWSWGSSKSGWIYYYPEKVRVQIAHEKDFGNLDLRRFAN